MDYYIHIKTKEIQYRADDDGGRYWLNEERLIQSLSVNRHMFSNLNKIQTMLNKLIIFKALKVRLNEH